MKIALRILIGVLFGALLLGCRTPESGTQSGMEGMEFDTHLAMTEAEIRMKYGEPQQCEIVPAKECRSTLHMPIYKKYAPNRLNTNIKELFYERDGNQLIFWLENKRQQWRVVGDAKFPKGVVF